jgi:hypothetical protein
MLSESAMALLFLLDLLKRRNKISNYFVDTSFKTFMSIHKIRW